MDWGHFFASLESRIAELQSAGKTRVARASKAAMSSFYTRGMIFVVMLCGFSVQELDLSAQPVSLDPRKRIEMEAPMVTFFAWNTWVGEHKP